MNELEAVANELRASLPNDERAPLDAYYTPYIHASACVRWLDANVFRGVGGPPDVLEPCAGGGAWVRACRAVWPSARLHAVDINPDAPGLRDADRTKVGCFHTLDLKPRALVVGNPPYAGDLVAWVDRSRELAPVVGYLMRSTFLGSAMRLPWFQERPPSDVVIVLPRPLWEGPGSRDQTDTCDSVFVVWQRDHEGPPRMHWLDARPQLGLFDGGAK